MRDRAATKVGLFITCLVDLIRPAVGFASVKLLEDAGCTVEVPRAQTCCGQPAYNSGDRADATAIARQVVDSFSDYDYVVVPSGSCGGMLRNHYSNLLADVPGYEQKVKAFADKTYEIVSFLTDVLKVERVTAQFDATVTYHDSCAGLRELGVKKQPRRLLASVQGLALHEMKDPETCCGFGGTFCVKYPDISNAIVEKKTADISASNADVLLAGDLGCLMNMAGKLKREGNAVQARHVVEVLAGMTDAPAIAQVTLPGRRETRTK